MPKPPRKQRPKAREPDRLDLGTAQTRAKLRYDVVERMHRERRLTDDQWDAALDIRFVWNALSRGLMPRASDPSAPLAHGAISDPFSRFRWSEHTAWWNRYSPWAAEMGVALFATAGRVRALQIVLDIVVDNYSCEATDRAYRLRNGTASRVVVDGLARYAEIADKR